MGGQGLNPLSLGGSENVGAEESESSTTEDVGIVDANGDGESLVYDSDLETLVVTPHE